LSDRNLHISAAFTFVDVLKSEIMSEAIGNLWQAGENLVRDGEPLEALLSFQRAKAMLITESKSVYADTTRHANVFIITFLG
jgi:hypothetical protein